jgi:hypothetical protein
MSAGRSRYVENDIRLMNFSFKERKAQNRASI